MCYTKTVVFLNYQASGFGHSRTMNSTAAMRYEGSAGQEGELFRQLSLQGAFRYAWAETMMNAERAR